MPQRKSVKFINPRESGVTKQQSKQSTKSPRTSARKSSENETRIIRRRRKLADGKKQTKKSANVRMDMSELRKLAKSKGIEVRGYNKAQLIDEINKR